MSEKPRLRRCGFGYRVWLGEDLLGYTDTDPFVTRCDPGRWLARAERCFVGRYRTRRDAVAALVEMWEAEHGE